MGLKWKGLKPIAIAVLVAFTTIALRVDLLAAPKAKPQTTDQKKVTAAAKFQDLLKDTEKLFEGMEADLGKKKDVSPRLAQLRQHRSDLQGLADNIRGEMAKTRAELISKKLPAEIIQRHDAFAQNFENNMKALLADLDEAEQAKQGQLQARVKAARDYLKKNIHRERHIPLDPNKLPHRRSDFKARKPITDPKEFKKLFPQTSAAPSAAPNQHAALSLGDHLTRLLGIGIAYAQGAADPYLAETIEVQFTQEIRDLAASLNHDPVKIYAWVRNNIEFVPTYGSIQGARMTLLSKQGNAFDISSLLIALLRVSNIKARYVYGTIEVPIDKVMNWVGGFTDAKSAADFIASGGIPVTAGISGGKITKARMEHVWVEAFVDYIPSRGAVHKEGDTWIPLDPSFKQYMYTDPQNLASAIGFDAEAFINKAKTGAIIDEENGYIKNIDPMLIRQEMETYQSQVENYIAQNFPEVRLSDIVGKKEILKREYNILPSSCPYRVLTILNQFADIPDTLRHKIEVVIAGDYGSEGLTYRANLPEIAGKRLTLSYVPATEHDEATVEQYGGDIYETPPYLINVKPVLKVEGENRAFGNITGMSQQQEFILRFIAPGSANEIRNNIIAGQYLGIGLDVGKVPMNLLKDHLAQTDSVVNQIKSEEEVDIDNLAGELYYVTAIGFFAELDLLRTITARYNSIVFSRQPAEAIAGNTLGVTYLFSIPYSTAFTGSYIDVDRDVLSVFAKDGNPNRKLCFMLAAGELSSSMENMIFEQLYSTPAVSAVKLIYLANQSGIATYYIDNTNIGKVLPQLEVSSDVKIDIQNAINSGNVVTIPQKNFQYYDWTGTGYIISDPNTGASAGMISGGLAGGATAINMKNAEIPWFIKFLLAFFPDKYAGLVHSWVTLVEILTSDTSLEAQIAAMIIFPIMALFTVLAHMVLMSPEYGLGTRLTGFFIVAGVAAILAEVVIKLILIYGKKNSGRSTINRRKVYV